VHLLYFPNIQWEQQIQKSPKNNVLVGDNIENEEIENIQNNNYEGRITRSRTKELYENKESKPSSSTE